MSCARIGAPKAAHIPSRQNNNFGATRNFLVVKNNWHTVCNCVQCHRRRCIWLDSGPGELHRERRFQCDQTSSWGRGVLTLPQHCSQEPQGTTALTIYPPLHHRCVCANMFHLESTNWGVHFQQKHKVLMGRRCTVCLRLGFMVKLGASKGVILKK